MKIHKVLLIVILNAICVLVLLGGCSGSAQAEKNEMLEQSNNSINNNTAPKFTEITADNEETIADVEKHEYEEFAEFIDNLLVEGNYGGSILVMQNENVILRNAYGMANEENNTENTLSTAFYIGPLTKQFTGAAILSLEAEGKLNAGDTLDKFFSGHTNLKNLSIADLLAMQGCFDDYYDYIVDLMKAGAYEKTNTLTAQDIETHILVNWNGEKNNNNSSSSDYYLLGRIIEQVSGMTFEEYIEMQFFIPTGMQDSGFAGAHASAMPDSSYSAAFVGDRKELLTLPFAVGTLLKYRTEC